MIKIKGLTATKLQSKNLGELIELQIDNKKYNGNVWTVEGSVLSIFISKETIALINKYAQAKEKKKK